MTITAAITFVDSETGRNYTVKLVKEGATTDDFSKRYIAAPIGWRDGRLAFMFSDVEGEPHEEARHVGNLFNLRREDFDGESWIVSDLDWDTDELALEAKRLVDEDRITGVSIQPTDGEGFMICGSPPPTGLRWRIFDGWLPSSTRKCVRWRIGSKRGVG